VVLGIDFGASKIAVAAAGVDGARLASATVPTRPELGGRAAFDRGVAAARRLVDGAPPGRELVAVGVSTIGIPFDDRVELAPTIPGWHGLALGRELSGAFEGAEIRLATDVKAATQAEARWGALTGCDPAIYLNLGTGLAAGVVAGGRVLAGRHGAAGEIGYNLRAVGDVGITAGERTVLEDVVSGQALLRRGAAAAGREVAAAAIFQASGADSGLRDLVGEFVDELAFHLVNLAILVDPQRIAVGGGLVRSWERLRPGLARALAAGVPFPPELVVAHFPFDAPLIGAIALAIEAAGHRRGDGQEDEDTARADGINTHAILMAGPGHRVPDPAPAPAGDLTSSPPRSTQSADASPLAAGFSTEGLPQ
jgi:predicted NBD/HSP70 family sugar kinase